MKKEVKSVIEIFKTILFIVLFISMSTLATVYICGTQNQNFYPVSDIPVEKMWMIQSNNISNQMKSYNKTHIIPEFIGFKFSTENYNDTPRGIISNRDLISEVYDTLLKYITKIYSNQSVCTILDIDNGNQLWNSCMNGNDYIYIQYHSAIPYPIIYTYSSGEPNIDNTKLANGNVVYVKEMFIKLNIIGNNRYNFSALTKDNENNIALFEIKESVGNILFYDSSDLKSYNDNEDFIDFEFLNDRKISQINEKITNIDLNDTFAIINAEIVSKQIDASFGLSSIFNDTSNNTLKSFLRLFGYNPDRISKYTEIDGSEIFIESHGKLKVSVNNYLTYTSKDKNSGLNISDYLGYGSESGEYNIYEIIKAINGIVDSLRLIDKNLIGGDADIGLSDIYYENENLVVEYKYYFDNIEILYSNSDNLNSSAMKFIINGKKIIYINMNSILIKNTLSKTVIFPQTWILEDINSYFFNLDKNNTVYGKFKLAYNLNVNKNSNESLNSVFSDWILVTKSKEEKYELE